MTVLHIDADPDALAILRALLEHHGHIVLAATSLPDAIRLAMLALPDVVVTELDVPGPTGGHVPEALRAAGITAPVIVWTADALPAARQRATRSRAAYWTKPANLDDILAAVVRLGSQRAQPTELPYWTAA